MENDIDRNMKWQQVQKGKLEVRQRQPSNQPQTFFVFPKANESVKSRFSKTTKEISLHGFLPQWEQMATQPLL